MPRTQYRSLWLHILIWLVYGLLTFSWISSGRFTYEQSFFLSLRTVVLHVGLFYFNIYVLLPKLISKNKYLGYALVLLLVLIAVFLLRQQLGEWILGDDLRLMDQGREGTARGGIRPRRGYFGITLRMFLDIMTSLAILFVSTVFWVIGQNRIRDQQASMLKQEHLENELKLLKNQVSPHFLLNALNNIYSLSRTRSDQSPEMIMKLSEMMRYVLYEARADQVPIEREVEYLSHYIDFQKIKSDSDVPIQMEMSIEDPNLPIAPMLLIPFVENAFKHGNVFAPQGVLKIKLVATKESITFQVSNSISSAPKDLSSGIGIGNIRRRLALLYPGRHILEAGQRENQYQVNMEVSL